MLFSYASNADIMKLYFYPSAGQKGIAMNDMLQKTANALRARGYEVTIWDNAAAARDFIANDIPAGQDVGIGGCETAYQMGIADALRQSGHAVHWHRGVPASEAGAVRRAAMLSPNYLCSANAVTEDGLIVQIDGTGNRVGAMCYGPSTVYIVVGRNKIVSGGYQDAVRRIKKIACPQNARRLGLQTPCATGECQVSACQHPMCNIFVALEHAPNAKTTKIILVDEDLGY